MNIIMYIGTRDVPTPIHIETDARDNNAAGQLVRTGDRFVENITG